MSIRNLRAKTKPKKLDLLNRSQTPDAPATSAPATPKPSAAPADTPQTPDALHHWIRTNLHVTIARTSVINDHQAPFDYLCHTFFEGALS